VRYKSRLPHILSILGNRLIDLKGPLYALQISPKSKEDSSNIQLCINKIDELIDILLDETAREEELEQLPEFIKVTVIQNKD
jgi:hypothetical protein